MIINQLNGGAGGWEVGDLLTSYATKDSKWLLCDGSVINQSTYPELYALYPDASAHYSSKLGSPGLNGITTYYYDSANNRYFDCANAYQIYYGTSGSTWGTAWNPKPSGISASLYYRDMCVCNGYTFILGTYNSTSGASSYLLYKTGTNPISGTFSYIYLSYPNQCQKLFLHNNCCYYNYGSYTVQKFDTTTGTNVGCGNPGSETLSLVNLIPYDSSYITINYNTSNYRYCIGYGYTTSLTNMSFYPATQTSILAVGVVGNYIYMMFRDSSDSTNLPTYGYKISKTTSFTDMKTLSNWTKCFEIPNGSGLGFSPQARIVKYNNEYWFLDAPYRTLTNVETGVHYNLNRNNYINALGFPTYDSSKETLLSDAIIFSPSSAGNGYYAITSLDSYLPSIISTYGSTYIRAKE